MFCAGRVGDDSVYKGVEKTDKGAVTFCSEHESKKSAVKEKHRYHVSKQIWTPIT